MAKKSRVDEGTTTKAEKARRRQQVHPDFKRPGIARITGRTTSLRGAFFAAITPVRPPTSEEVDAALALLNMSSGNCRCAYCGNTLSEWDHFYPIVRDSEPTGYITELANLVPSCGKCNQSKGNANWEEWMRGDAPLSPKTRNISDLEDRIARLRLYASSYTRTQLDYSAILGPERWAKYKGLLKEAIDNLERAEDMADELRSTVQAHLHSGAASPAQSTPTIQIELSNGPEAAAQIAVGTP